MHAPILTFIRKMSERPIKGIFLGTGLLCLSLLKGGQPGENRFGGQFLDAWARVNLCGGDPLRWGWSWEHCVEFGASLASACKMPAAPPPTDTHLEEASVSPDVARCPLGGSIASGREPPHEMTDDWWPEWLHRLLTISPVW